MSDSTKKKIRLIYGIVLSVMLIVTGILLMVSCVSVYQMGTRPFTTQNISAAFSKIAVVVWITVGAVLAGGILALILPEEKKKPLALKDKKDTLARLLGRLNPEAIREDLRAKMDGEKKFCKYLRIAAILLSVAVAIPALVYVLNFKHFEADYDQSVIKACLWVLPCTFASMGIALTCSILENASIERQIALAKTAMIETRDSLVSPAVKENKQDNRIVTIVRIAIAAAAIIFMVAGIPNGGMADVLSKAINICTECIGLG